MMVARALILLAAALIRIRDLGARSLWLDEHTSLEVAGKSLVEIFTGAGFNSHTPPFYYAVLHVWLQFFPADEVGLRAFAVVADVAAIAAGMKLFSRQFDARIGIAYGLLHCLSPYAVYYAQEGRMYSFTMLLVLLCADGLLKLKEGDLGAVNIAMLILFAVAGMYTHYYFAFAFFSLLVGYSFVLRSDRRKLRALFGVAITVGICFLPWLGVVSTLLASEGQDFRRFVFSVLPYTFFRFAAGYAVMPLNYGTKDAMVATVVEHWASFSAFTICFLVASVSGAIVLVRRSRKDAVVVLSALLLPALLALVVSLYTPMLSERYLIVSYPYFLCILAMSAFGWLKPTFGGTSPLFIVVLLLFGFGLDRHFRNPDFGNTQWREAAGVMNSAEGRCRNAIVNPHYIKGLVEYHLRGADWQLFAVDDRDELETAATAVAERECRGYWLIERATSGSLEAAALEATGGRYELEYRQFYHLENGVNLSYYAVGNDEQSVHSVESSR